MDLDTIKDLGVDVKAVRKFKTIEELRKHVPNMVLGEAVDTFSFSINHGTPKPFPKGSKKVISMYVYKCLEYDPKTRKKQLKPSDITFRDAYRPYRGQDLNGKRLLVWRTGGIGDLLFIQPNLRWLKENFDCEILFSCSPVYYPLLDHWKGCFDKVVDFPIDFVNLDKTDYHITFEGVIERCEEAEYTNAYKLFSKWMYTQPKKENLIPKLHPIKKEDEAVKDILRDNKIDPYSYVVFQFRASSPIRTPSTELWKKIVYEVVDRGYKVIVTDSPRMTDKLDIMLHRDFDSKYRDKIFNFSSFSKTLSTSISLVNLSKMIVAPDSSFIHIAAGLNVPVLGIYGAFSGDVRMSTYKNVGWVEPPENKEVCEYGGRYCFSHGHTPCKWTKKGKCVPCYDHIKTEDINNGLDYLLKIERG